MKPIEFEGCNQVVAKDQPEYRQMPCMSFGDVQGTKLFCWKLTLRERVKILFTGRLWQYLLTFNQPQHPQLLIVDDLMKVRDAPPTTHEETAETVCPECQSVNWPPSESGKGCQFCDGTEGGNPP